MQVKSRGDKVVLVVPGEDAEVVRREYEFAWEDVIEALGKNPDRDSAFYLAAKQARANGIADLDRRVAVAEHELNRLKQLRQEAR